MKSEQPEALRLADELSRAWQPTAQEAAAELRRLHAENEALRAQLSEKNIGQGVPVAWNPTDDELTTIYKKSNGEDVGKAQPLTTQRIFKAMRAMLASSPPAPQAACIACGEVGSHKESCARVRWGVEQAAVVQQEPFGWVSMGKIRFTPPTSDQDTYTAVYTHPAPPQTSLTDEQIFRIAAITHDGISPHMDTLGFARAIEAANNIGEKK